MGDLISRYIYGEKVEKPKEEYIKDMYEIEKKKTEYFDKLLKEFINWSDDKVMQYYKLSEKEYDTILKGQIKECKIPPDLKDVDCHLSKIREYSTNSIIQVKAIMKYRFIIKYFESRYLRGVNYDKVDITGIIPRTT